MAALNLKIFNAKIYKDDDDVYNENDFGNGQPESKGGATPLVGVEDPCLRSYHHLVLARLAE